VAATRPSPASGAIAGMRRQCDLHSRPPLPPGSRSIVYTNRWVLSLVDTWRRDGARSIAYGGMTASDVVAALDATKSS
jgi:hypothetical protein